MERNLESLNTTKYCICHSDLHFDNILVDENDNISILDYDRLRISSIDYELDALFTMVNSPDLILHIEKKAIPPNAFECAIPLVLKNYPELFDFPNLQKRCQSMQLSIIYPFLNSIRKRYKNIWKGL